MKKLVLIANLIGHLTTTSYRAVPSQTDSTPLYTSTNQHVEVGGAAISRDLLCGACRKLHHRCAHPEYTKRLHYGDWIYVDGFGFRQINDVMGSYSSVRKGKKRVHISIKQHVDIFVRSYREEKEVNVRACDVFKITIGESK